MKIASSSPYTIFDDLRDELVCRRPPVCLYEGAQLRRIRPEIWLCAYLLSATACGNHCQTLASHNEDGHACKMYAFWRPMGRRSA